MIFEGTAQWYVRFRPPYPEPLVRRVATALALESTSRVLDLGAGTGLLSARVAPLVREIVAIDCDPAMLHASPPQSTARVRRIAMRAEDVSPALGRFHAVMCGNAFLWMDRARVLTACASILAANGGLAIAQQRSFWDGDEPWRVAVLAVIRRWLGPQRRTVRGVFDCPLTDNAAVVRAAGYRAVAEEEFSLSHTWDFGRMLGFLFSTSFCSHALLGTDADAFAVELERAWRTTVPGGTVTETITYDLVLGQAGHAA